MVSPIRLGGLASGMDIDLMVKDLMKVQRMKADKLYQSKQVLQWQQEDYRSINSLMLNFRNCVFDMRLQSTLMKNSVTISDDSIAGIAAGTAAREGSYTLKVNALAEQAVKKSGGSLSKPLEGETIGDTVSINSSNNEFGLILDGVEKTITITEGDYSIEALVGELQLRIDSAVGAGQGTVGSIAEGPGTNRITFQPTGEYKPQITLKRGENDALETLGFNDSDYFRINLSVSLKDIAGKFENDPFAVGDGLIEFRINGRDFSYDFSEGGPDEDKSLSSILSDINNNAEAGVLAYYDSITDKVIIKSKDYGAGAKVSIENLEGNLFGANGALQIDESVSYGQNSQIELNGVVIIKNSNKFTIEGLSFDLKEASAEVVAINVAKYTQGAFDAIKNFVDEYNKIIEAIHGKLFQERFRDYAPLTDEQKEAMSDREVELWEERARSGLLRNDSLLSSILSEMRTLAYRQVEGTGSVYSTLSSIGITTKDYREYGKLHVDENRLKEALNNDLEGVVSLFGQSSEADDEKGIAVRLYDIVNRGMTRLSDKAGSSTSLTTYDSSYIGQGIREMDKRIESMEEYLTRMEDRYWQQFTAMEKALNEMNSQSMWLSQQLMFWGN
ncbi:MAG: flagellar filament capping protein FliD [Clostridiales bacterium]|nr:flagellar filament capping protein FliD [Clostridiales bacterium]